MKDNKLYADYISDFRYQFEMREFKDLGNVLVAKNSDSKQDVDLTLNVINEYGVDLYNYIVTKMQLGYHTRGFCKGSTIENCFKKFKKEFSNTIILPVMFQTCWVQMVGDDIVVSNFIIPNVASYENLCKSYKVPINSTIVDVLSKLYEFYSK
jgi:hypothetical protein